jgi:transposase
LRIYFGNSATSSVLQSVEVNDMAKPLTLTLTPEQRQELEYGRDHHGKAYVRERCAAILKITDGMSGRQVARHGLLKERDPDTVYSWFHRYQAEGLAGLLIRPGRGRKPAFSPQHADGESACQSVLVIVRREPVLFGFHQTRWTLGTIRQACPWLQDATLSGTWKVLDRLGISYKRGRSYIRSPDEYYDEKLSLIQLCLLRTWYEPERYVLLYLDELTYYRQPTIARAYEVKGHPQPLARLSYKSDTHFRVVGALNAITGQVTYRQHYKTGLRQLSDFYAAIRTDYRDAEEVYVAQDNWPVHFHPDVLARLQPQDFFPWSPKVPPNWPTEPRPKAVQDDLPVRLLLLPTYASWLNPIEKLWRWLKQEVIHLHRKSDDWQGLKLAVANFLDRFKDGSPELLRYVGLLPN